MVVEVLMKKRFLRRTPSKRKRKAGKKQKYNLPKIITIGNSKGVILRTTILEDLDWKLGDRVEYEYDDKEKVLKIRNYSAEQREYARESDALY